MPRSTKKKPVPEGKIEKSEDKVWQDWYNKLDAKEHEKHLAQLGLDDEDIQEWEEAEGFKKPTSLTDPDAPEPKTEGKKKKAVKKK